MIIQAALCGMDRGGHVGREISKNTASMGKESYAEGLGWDSASADGEDKTDTRNIQEANQQN